MYKYSWIYIHIIDIHTYHTFIYHIQVAKLSEENRALRWRVTELSVAAGQLTAAGNEVRAHTHTCVCVCVCVYVCG